MAVISRPALYGILALVAIGAWWWSSSDSGAPVKSGARKSASKKNNGNDWVFFASDYPTPFDKPAKAMRDIFKPLLYVEKVLPKVDQAQLMIIPTNLAKGEANWAYTGMVEVNGVRMALLENSSSRQGGYVKEGETWKQSQIVSITTECIVLAGPDGSEGTVYRYNPNLPPKQKPTPDAGFQPVDLGSSLSGPIGSDIQIKRVPEESGK